MGKAKRAHHVNVHPKPRGAMLVDLCSAYINFQAPSLEDDPLEMDLKVKLCKFNILQAQLAAIQNWTSVTKKSTRNSLNSIITYSYIMKTSTNI